MTTTEPTTVTARSEALIEHLFGASIATLELFAVYLGDRLGYYRALATNHDATAGELAARTGTNERYTREWLEQQAVAGILDVEDTGDPATRRFSLPVGHDEVLTNRDSLSYIAPLARQVVGMTSPLPALLDAFRTGSGVPYPDYGTDTREGIADLNRVMFINQLASEWIPAMPDIHARLRDSDHPARVADIGCGIGWSSISLAQGYPGVRVDGFDIDDASIATAQATATELGLSDRVHFQARDGGDPDLTDHYDFACAFECIHDMADPVATLSAMRRLVGPGGAVLIGDERVAEEFNVPGDELERLMYGFSVLHCLPVGLADEPSVGTGTVMRPDTLRQYAREAGFASLDILPIENDFWRFYELTA